MVAVLVTTHVLSGAVIGTIVTRPDAAFAAGVASHFVLDSLPHWGAVSWDEMLPIAVRDGLTGLAAMAAMTALAPRDRRLRVLAGMTGAAFPDLDKPAKQFFGRSPFPRRFDAFHLGIQRESPHRMPQEILVGAVAAALAVVAVRRR